MKFIKNVRHHSVVCDSLRSWISLRDSRVRGVNSSLTD
jgi:hypothetical protein